MNLHNKLLQTAEQGRPIKIGMIGAGRFAEMFLSQAQFTPGMHVAAIAELDASQQIDLPAPLVL